MAEKPEENLVISYCTECKPPQILAAGPAPGVSHRLPTGAVHSKTIKTIPMEPKDFQKPGEKPWVYLARLQRDLKAKLV
jgi:hypothetical protein